MIYKKLKGSQYIWNPESTLVFKNRKAIGRYIGDQIVFDEEVIDLCKRFNVSLHDDTNRSHKKDPFEEENSTEKEVKSELTSSYESIETQSVSNEEDIYENHPAFMNCKPQTNLDFIENLTDEFKLKMNEKVNDLIYKIVDLEATLKNLNNDYESLLVENESLKRKLNKTGYIRD